MSQQGEEIQPPETPADVPEQEKSKSHQLSNRVVAFYFANEFIVLVIVSILIAKAYPKLGAEYVHPDITASWIAVIFIFTLAGLALRTEEFVNAFRQVYFNTFVHVFNFGVVSSIVFGFACFTNWIGLISDELADGMAICGSLSITVNMCVVMTVAAGGDEAAAIFNTALGNVIGIFLSPLLILGYVGDSGNVPLITTVFKLGVRVLLPLLIGQILRKTSKALVAFVKKHKPYFAKSQEYALVFIIYTTFCETFSNSQEFRIGEMCLLIFFQFTLLCIVMTLAWTTLGMQFPNDPKLRVMGIFGCTQKTVAVGIPLISAIYERNPNAGLYALPLLIWHPMQLILGTALTPKLRAFVEREEARLGALDEVPSQSEPPSSNDQGVVEEDIIVDATEKA